MLSSAAHHPQTCLITGGNGFIGRYIVERLLDRGDQVRVLGRRRYPELEALGVECFETDLSTQADCSAALRGCDVVYHVAAQAGIWGAWPDFYRNNVTATQHILRSAVRAGVPRFVFTSSPSAVFGAESLEGVDASHPYPLRYLNYYSYTKALAERFVLAQQDILTVAIRPHIVWGPRDPHILPRLLRRARSGRLRRVGDGTNLVDVTYVENAAEAHILAAAALSATSPLRNRAYFIGQEQPVVLWDFINTLLDRLGIRPVTRGISYPLAYRLGWGLELAYRALSIPQEPPMTRFLATQLGLAHWFDQRPAQRDFGYGPRISTEEGLRRTVAALLAEEQRRRPRRPLLRRA